MMKRPDTTYRLQLSQQFTFSDLEKIVDYLDDLGITTIYSAPIFQAKEGSTHGYDVLDPFAINKSIGELDQLKAIAGRLNKKSMCWLQDIVPNHMAFDSKNPWLRNIFELGPRSRFYHFFDIDWEYKGLKKVMAPFLGDTLEQIIKDKELSLNYSRTGIFFKYFENEYPVSMDTYSHLLATAGHSKLIEKIVEFD